MHLKVGAEDQPYLDAESPFRHRRDRSALTTLAFQLARWLGAHLPELERAEPVMPLEDRAADTWEPLIAVADLAAGEWPALARHAAIVLTVDRDQAADMSDRIRLLADCRTAFGDADVLPSTALVTRLRSDPEAPWCEPAPGITPKRLAGLLADYDIRSVNHRFPEPIGQVKGYFLGRLHRRMGPLLPTPDRETVPSVPSVPSVPAQLSPGTDQNLGRIDPSHQNTRPRADLRRDGWDGYPPLRRHQRRRWCRVTRPEPTRISEVLTVDEFCAELKISKDTFYHWRKVGTAPVCHRLPNGELHIGRADRDAWLAKLRDVA